jgi:hypothetical protein
MAGVLGRAFVQVFADLSKFTPGLRENIKKSLDEQTKGMKMEELDKSAEKAGESAAENVGKGLDSKIEKETDREGRKGGSSLMKGLSAGVGAAMAAFFPIMIAFGVQLAAALAPAALALGATLPAAIFTMVGAMAVLKMATSGVGAAIKASFDPANAAAFQKALDKLSPAARSFVKEIQGLHPAFKALQQDVQQVFFVQLQGALTRVATQLLPTLRSGLRQLSADLGRMGAGLLQAFGNGKEDLASIFIAAHEAIKPFIPLVGALAGAFLTVAAVAGPLFAALSGGFAGLLQDLVDFLNAEAASGGMAQFFDDALVILKQLGGILGNVFGLVMQVLGALQSTGTQGLGLIGDLVGMLNDFFATAEGHDALVAVFTLLNVALSALSQILTPLLPVIAQLAGEFAGQLSSAIIKLTPYLVAMAQFLANNPSLLKAAVIAWMAFRAALIAVSIAEGIMDALNPVGWIILAVAAIAAGAYLIYKNWGAVTAALKSAWGAITGFFTGIWNWIVTVGKDIGNWFTVTLPNFFASIPGRIGAALAALPGLIGGLFLDALRLAGEAIGIGIGVILAIFIKAPGLIWDAIKGIGHLLVDVWNIAFATGKAILTAGVNAVIFIFTELPGKIFNFVNRLPGIIGGAFRSAFNSAKNFVKDGANDIVDFVKALPGRIGNFMRNVGTDILGGLRSGINAVIGGFNNGINKVGGFLHIGLPNIPMLASGGLVNAPTLAVVGEAGPEAVVPMSDPSRARAVAKSTGLLSMLGSAAGAAVTNVKVYLGTREITDILNTQIDSKLNDQANELAYGTR